MEIGIHASHEQLKPSRLLKNVQEAERQGCKVAMCSDHFAPWSLNQGESGYAWSWLGSALQATSMEFGVVSAPGQRYHPAIAAQKIATLSEMFPGRLWVALGSGQLLNEHVTGQKWPEKEKRNQRLKLSALIIRQLLDGETVSCEGLVTVSEARLYTLPQVKPLLFGAALTEETAHWMGAWADGLITIGQERKKLEKIINAFRSGGGVGKPLHLQEQISFARTDREAFEIAKDQWRPNIFPSAVLSNIAHPEQFDQMAAYIDHERLHEGIRISSDPKVHIEWLQTAIDLGFDKVFIHDVNREAPVFYEAFQEKVFPHLVHRAPERERAMNGSR